MISDTSNSQSTVSTKHVCLQHAFALAVAATAVAATVVAVAVAATQQCQYQKRQYTLCNPVPIIHPFWGSQCWTWYINMSDIIRCSPTVSVHYFTTHGPRDSSYKALGAGLLCSLTPNKDYQQEVRVQEGNEAKSLFSCSLPTELGTDYWLSAKDLRSHHLSIGSPHTHFCCQVLVGHTPCSWSCRHLWVATWVLETEHAPLEEQKVFLTINLSSLQSTLGLFLRKKLYSFLLKVRLAEIHRSFGSLSPQVKSSLLSCTPRTNSGIWSILKKYLLSWVHTCYSSTLVPEAGGL